MNPDKLPEYERGDSLRSILAIGKVAVAELIMKIDTKYSNLLNGDEDE